MNIFLTGASGYIGSSVAKQLIAKGHTVYGLIRNKDKADAVSKLGIIPVPGTLEDRDLLFNYARKADAVIHTADADHRTAIETMLTALEGSGKIFIHTSGSSVVGDDVWGDYENPCIFDETTPFSPMEARKERVAINELVRSSGTARGIRTIIILPAMVYGDSLGLDVESDQLPVLYRKSREAGKGIYIGKGINKWSNVHISDLADLYLLALEKAPAGSFFYAENGEESYRNLACFISKALGFEGLTTSWKAAEAFAELGDWARFALGSNSRVRATQARRLLGWAPTGPGISDWILYPGK